MTLLRLSLVTEALLDLIEAAVTASVEWPSATTLTASPDPPDRLSGNHTIGLYLYHAIEDPHRRNDPPPGGTALPDRHTPMPLLLHYVLTAHSEHTAGEGTYVEQLMMGLAMKALRDHPRIDDNTTVEGTQPMPAALRGRGNAFLITPQAVPATDAVAYWTAGQSPTRMATYYQCRAVLLEPEPVTRRAGRVLSYGVHTIVRGAPRLSGSRNVLTFALPGEPVPREVEAQPAQAAIGDAFELLGSELAGDTTQLVLEHPSWPEPAVVDTLQWGVVAQPDRVQATVRDEAAGQPVLPGVYAASVAVVTELELPGGGVRPVTARSNVTPFCVAPAVGAIGAPTAERRVTVDGGRFDDALLSGDDIQVFLGAAPLARRAAGVTLPGEFRVVSSVQLELRFPDDAIAGAQVPLRLVVRGVESAPRWVTVP